MWPLLTGLVTGGASLLGNIFSAQQSAANTSEQIYGQSVMQQESEKFNAQQAQMNRDFQQQMSSTAYQRASQDMKAAGLNPMMMFGSGSSASTPGGSSASVGTPTMPNVNKPSPWAGLGEAVKAGLSTAVQSKEMDLLTSKAANVDLENKMIQRQLDSGKPEVDVEQVRSQTGLNETRSNLIVQLRNMNIPAEEKARIWDDLPNAVKKGQVWSEVGGDVAGNVVPVGRIVRGLKNFLGPSGSSASAVRRKFGGYDTPTEYRNSADFKERFGDYGLSGE